MKKYTLERISVKGLKLFDFPVDITYYNSKKEREENGRCFEYDTVVGLTTFNNELCLETINSGAGTAYIPISELMRIGILEEQPKEIHFDIWN